MKTSRLLGKRLKGKSFRRINNNKKIARKIAEKSLNRKIRTQVARLAETKEKRTAVANVSLSGDPASVVYVNGFFDPQLVISSITNGPNVDDRIGNKIRLTRVTFNAMIRANYDRTVPMVVMMLVMSDKHHPTTASANNWNDAAFGNAGAVGGNILQDGDSSVGFAKRLTDSFVPINTDRYTVYQRKLFKIGRADANAANSNNDFSLMRRIKVNVLKYMPKIYRWNDATTSSLNRKVFIAFHVMLADGGQLTLPNDQAVWIDYNWDIRWKDM